MDEWMNQWINHWYINWNQFEINTFIAPVPKCRNADWKVNNQENTEDPHLCEACEGSKWLLCVQDLFWNECFATTAVANLTNKGLLTNNNRTKHKENCEWFFEQANTNYNCCQFIPPGNDWNYCFWHKSWGVSQVAFD